MSVSVSVTVDELTDLHYLYMVSPANLYARPRSLGLMNRFSVHQAEPTVQCVLGPPVPAIFKDPAAGLNSFLAEHSHGRSLPTIKWMIGSALLPVGALVYL